jgi:histidinol phosphatase-like enzyme (inositol monophosphatase family)
MNSLMDAAAEIAQLSGKMALSFFSPAIAVETKSDGSPVTAADRAAEGVARDWIDRHFPEDGVLGEELGETRPGAARRWILDPIDGTRTFVRGVPLWGTLVALAEGENVLVGAAYFPAVNELLVAAPGQGCFWNGQRCGVSSVAKMAEATVLTTDERFPNLPERRDAYRRLSDAAALGRSWGDCYGYLMVATGRAEAMTDGILSPWDSASLLPIIEEAGGVFTNWEGRRTAFGNSAVATNAALADPIRKLLGSTREGKPL